MLALLFAASLLSIEPASSPAKAPPQIPPIFEIDRAHSKIGFAVRFMGLSTVEGSFSDYNGAIVYSDKDPANSSVTVAIRTASIWTGHEGRDRHLRSPDFFEAEKNPVILFRSEKIEKTRKGFLARGKLTMHGVTRDIAIPFTRLHDKVSDAWGNQRIGFHGQTRLSKKDYAIQGTAFWNSEYDPGKFAVSDSVDVILEISATQINWDRRKRRIADTLLAVTGREGVTAAASRFRTELAQRTDSVGPNAVNYQDIQVAGSTLLQHKRPKEAAELLAVWVDAQPQNPFALEALGQARLESGDSAGALEAFERVLANDPNRAFSLELVKRLKSTS